MKVFVLYEDDLNRVHLYINIPMFIKHLEASGYRELENSIVFAHFMTAFQFILGLENDTVENLQKTYTDFARSEQIISSFM